MIRFLFLLLFVSTIPDMALANNSCPKLDPKVSVTKVRKDTEYIRGMSIREMTQVHTGSVRVGGPSILGLAGAERMSLGLEARFKKTNIGSGLICVAPYEVIGRFTVFPIMMVAKEFQEGTCEYNAVLEHEKDHVRTMLGFQSEYAPKYKRFLKKLVKRYAQPVVTSPSQTQTTINQIEQSMAREISAYFRQISPVHRKRQQQLDTPEEYARVFAKCSGWDRATAPRYQRRYR